MATLDKAGPATFKTNVEHAGAAIADLQRSANGEIAKLVPPVQAALTAYEASFSAYSTAKLAADALYYDQMRPEILTMQQKLDGAVASLTEDFETSRTEAAGAVADASLLQEILAAVALLHRHRARLPDRPQHRRAAWRDDRRDGPARRRRPRGRGPGPRQPRRDRRHGARRGGVQTERHRRRPPRARTGGRACREGAPAGGDGASHAGFRQVDLGRDGLARGLRRGNAARLGGDVRGGGRRARRSLRHVGAGGEIVPRPDLGRRRRRTTDLQRRRDFPPAGRREPGGEPGGATRRVRATRRCRGCRRPPRASATWCT